MADVFLIVSVTVAFLILFVVAVYLLVYYQHPDDHNEAYFPKFVVIIGIMLAGATALLLPLDVANNEGYPGTSLFFFVARSDLVMMPFQILFSLYLRITALVFSPSHFLSPIIASHVLCCAMA